jgi:2-iminobutanoate/2-iminopropanoate deaminase
LLFISGQLSIDPVSQDLVGSDVTEQAHQAARNIGAILAANGLGFGDVVKTTCYLRDMADFAAFNAVYEGYFTSKPARACVEVSALPKGGLCEIESVAEFPE